MLLKNLIYNLPYEKIIGNDSVEVTDIVSYSNYVVKNSLFVCIDGVNRDGHDYSSDVVRFGASCIVCEKELNVNITQVIVKDARKFIGLIASRFYGDPYKKLKLIGVCGTNGKTTTCHILKKIFDDAKIKCGVIGTLGVFYDDKFLETGLTTPDPIEFHKILKSMVDANVKVVVMEVSAHAIYLNKLYGVKFEIGVFTNFSQDHLDFFKDMETYKKVKKSFFFNNVKYCVLNVDDQTGLELSKDVKRAITYGINNPSDVFAIDVLNVKDGLKFIMNLFDTVNNIKMHLFGTYNVYNALASATVASLLGVKIDSIVKSLNFIEPIEGRMEKVYDNGFRLFIDYAHTPDGLEKSILALKSITKGKVITVFGCGGNRDELKRKIMGRISGELSDFTIITTDNPRFEDPMSIIEEIEKGVLEVSKDYVVIEDRKEAINYAINYAKPYDSILIAGKGAEKYQDVLGVKKVYSDKDVIREIFSK